MSSAWRFGSPLRSGALPALSASLFESSTQLLVCHALAP